jgi:hypothetical protein
LREPCRALHRVAGGIEAHAHRLLRGGEEVRRHAGDVGVVAQAQLAEGGPARAQLLLALVDGLDVAVDGDLRGRRRAGAAQLHEGGLREVERARGVVGARQVHLGARVVRQHGEHALEGDDGVLELAAVQGRDAQQVVVLRHAREAVLHRDQLRVCLLRVAGREELPGVLHHRVVGSQGRHHGQGGGERQPPDVCARIHWGFFLLFRRSMLACGPALGNAEFSAEGDAIMPG